MQLSLFVCFFKLASVSDWFQICRLPDDPDFRTSGVPYFQVSRSTFYVSTGIAASLETQGQIVGPRERLNGRKNMARRKAKNGEKSPWGQCLTRPVPNGRRRSAFWLGRKTQKFSGTKFSNVFWQEKILSAPQRGLKIIVNQSKPTLVIVSISLSLARVSGKISFHAKLIGRFLLGQPLKVRRVNEWYSTVLLFFIVEDKGKRGQKYNHVWTVWKRHKN